MSTSLISHRDSRGRFIKKDKVVENAMSTEKPLIEYDEGAAYLRSIEKRRDAKVEKSRLIGIFVSDDDYMRIQEAINLLLPYQPVDYKTYQPNGTWVEDIV